MVSIIVPVFNKADLIGNCLSSLINQTYKDYEVIIIDDGSMDKSKDVINLMIYNDSRFKYYYQKNQGVSVARNVGISKATRDYICFLDADDEYNKYYIVKMLFSIGNNDACACPHYINSEKNRKKAKFSRPDSGFIYSYLANICTPNTNSWLVRRDLIKKNNIYFKENISWGEDMMFFSEVILKANKVVFCDEYLTIYNVGITDSLSSNNIEKIKKDIYWLNIVQCNINNSLLDCEYKMKCINMIEGYRLPGAILYRILYNINNLSKKDLYAILYENRAYLRKLSFVNGLRSLKMYLLYLFIRTLIFFK